ncbi:MAG: hypothetical protein AAF682_29750 [Planctomycetota bacterium]
MRRGRRLGATLLAAGLALASAAGCAPPDDSPPPVPWPAGTAFAVGGEPVSAAAVERAAARVALIYPQRSRSHHVRRALQSQVLPRAALGVVYAESRSEAEAACRATADALHAGGEPPADRPVNAVRGNWGDLRLFYWGIARELELGAWSDPVERMGHFALVQLIERSDSERRGADEELSIRVVEFPYLPVGFAPKDLDEALASVRLIVVDPAYEPFVPEDLRYRMIGRKKDE